MTEIRKILLPLTGIFSLESLIRRSGQGIIFPFYHLVSDNPPAHIRHLYKVKSIRDFDSDLDQLLRYFEPISPEILLSEKPVNTRKPAFILSFDDGLKEITQHVLPLLEKKGLNAIFFLNNHFINNQGLFFRYKVSLLIDKLPDAFSRPSIMNKLTSILGLKNAGKEKIKHALMRLDDLEMVKIDRIAQLFDIDFSHYLATYKPYMDETQVREILNKGFYVGAHSNNHLSFDRFSPEEQYDEIKKSICNIKERFELTYSLFSFPFTDTNVSREVFLRLFDRPHVVLDASFGTSGLKQQEAYPHYQRIPMEKTAYGAEKYLKTEYFYYLLKSVAGLNRMRRNA